MCPERKITKINQHIAKFQFNVAIYSRVSTTHESQLESLKNQIEYFKAMVDRRLDWDLVGIYTDIKSGNSITGRAGFHKMLNDCRNHKIDIILTKSVSRFGRRTEKVMDVITELRSLGVDVLFDVENIWISESSKMFLLTIIEAIAEEESKARSENITWGIKRGFADGSSKLYLRRCFGYSICPDGTITINDEEADVVRHIFDLYLKGYSILAITRELKLQGIKSPTGKETWPKRSIETILTNEKYIGNSLVGKTYTHDYKEKIRYVNNGKHPKFQLANTHPQIISNDLFEKAQQEKENRSNINRIDVDKTTRKSTHYSMMLSGNTRSSSDSSNPL
jgi:DNA invertase Pin-like site-specific DNA recombinase